LKRYAEAVAGFDRVLAVDPGHALALSNRGIALSGLKQHEAAIESYDRALAIDPGDAQIWHNRGNVLQELGRLEAAVASYEAAIARHPAHAEAYNNRGNALAQLRQFAAALASYDHAYALDPHFKFLLGHRRQMRLQLCDWEGLEADAAELAARIQRGQPAALPFTTLALSDSAALQFQAAEIFIREEYPPDASLGAPPRRGRREKIRVGYFSADFRHHPVAVLLVEMIERHDRGRFEPYAFSLGADTQDSMRRRLERAFDRFIDVSGRSDREVTLLARDMELDIAIDLGGFTTGGRPRIFSARAAPLQVSYLGYPGTLGAPYIDYLMADPVVVPEKARQFYAESIIDLPCGFMVHDSQRAIADPGFTRRQFCLPETAPVFCCFNNGYKIGPVTFAGWMRILKAVPGSVLWLSVDDAAAHANLRRAAASDGVPAERLIFAERMPSNAEHLGRLGLADLFLDTSPYNAHATALDALWAGVPVLTCPGETFASRVAASLLSAAGMPDLIAATPQQYEERAIELGHDPALLGANRERLRLQRACAPLFDTPQLTRYIEAAFSAIYDRYQSGLAPASTSLPAITARR
jgi:predicted O-linked N-acetylglucosamine transferase (SPINDLY family)